MQENTSPQVSPGWISPTSESNIRSVDAINKKSLGSRDDARIGRVQIAPSDGRVQSDFRILPIKNQLQAIAHKASRLPNSTNTMAVSTTATQVQEASFYEDLSKKISGL